VWLCHGRRSAGGEKTPAVARPNALVGVATDTRVADTPHSPPGRPVVGNALSLGRDPLRFLSGVQRAYGDRYPLIRVAAPSGPPTSVVLDADLVHEVLGDRGRFRRPALGPQARRREGLLTSDGDLWERQRDLLDPEFVGPRLASHADTAGDAVAALLETWPEAGEVDLLAEAGTLTLQTITRALFGRDVTRAQSEAVRAALDTFGEELAFSPLAVVLPDAVRPGPSAAFEAADETLEAFAREIVDWHLDHDDPPRSLLTPLVEARRDPSTTLSENELVDQTLLFVTAGHETTALAVTYALVWLSRRPSVRERVHDEASRVLDGGRPGWSDLPALSTTERVVRETLRLTPPAWNVTRETRRPVRLRGHRLDDGELLFLSPYAHGRDARVWDAPDEFRPERWRGDASRAEPAYFPFGSGPRSCIGRQLALVEAQFALAGMLGRYDVTTTVDDLGFRPAATLQPDGPVTARVEARD
jgi:cytochrome P450